ncbi:uncharacterized protein PHACADRAFT_52490, partial [Phanerochaete carnosa HHB-10118-sp]
MQKCVELSRLSKAKAGAPRSVNFRRTTPGAVNPTLFLGWTDGDFERVDPAHPSAQYAAAYMKQVMPSAKQPGFVLRAYPKGGMFRPDVLWPSPPFRLAAPRERQVHMSLVTVTRRDSLYKHIVYRRAVKARITQAVSLIVTRGADVKRDGGGRPVLTFTNRPDRSLVLADWTYAIAPLPMVYRMPWPQLVRSLRMALHHVRDQGRRFEVR